MSEYLNPNVQLEVVKDLYSTANLQSAGFDLNVLFCNLKWNDKVDQLRRWACNERGVPTKEFDKAHHIWRINERLGGYPRDVVEFVDLFCARHDVQIRFDNTMCATGLGLEPDAGSLSTDIYLLGAQLNLPISMRGKDAIAEALAKFTRTNRDNQIAAAQAAIIAQPSPHADAEWQRLAEAFADPKEQSHGYTIRVLQSTIWQVKRKLVNDPAYPVTDHQMMILTGPQGSGKTTVLTSFFSPMHQFVYMADFQQLTDSKNFDLWRHYIVFFDEMAYAQRTDIDSVKNAITSTHRTSRLHHSHSSANIRNCSTFVGATNGSLGTILYDKTGLRRYAPIATMSAPHLAATGVPVVNWNTINSINFALLWQSVDHTAAHPLMSDSMACDEWRTIIEGERAKDAAEQFVYQFEPRLPRYRLADLFDHFRDYCRTANERELSQSQFSKRLRDLEAKPEFPFRSSKSGGNVWWYPKSDAKVCNVVQLNPRRDVTDLLGSIDAREA